MHDDWCMRCLRDVHACMCSCMTQWMHGMLHRCMHAWRSHTWRACVQWRCDACMHDAIMPRGRFNNLVYWAPLTQSQRRCMQLSWLLFLWHMLDDATEGLAKHNFLGCNDQSATTSMGKPVCSAALVPNALLQRDEGLGKHCAVDRASQNIAWHPLGTRTGALWGVARHNHKRK